MNKDDYSDFKQFMISFALILSTLMAISIFINILKFIQKLLYIIPIKLY